MTASHEFGHSLGLSHSDDQRSLMAPFYKSPPRNGGTNVLKEDDLLGIQVSEALRFNPSRSNSCARSLPVPASSHHT